MLLGRIVGIHESHEESLLHISVQSGSTMGEQFSLSIEAPLTALSWANEASKLLMSAHVVFHILLGYEGLLALRACKASKSQVLL